MVLVREGIAEAAVYLDQAAGACLRFHGPTAGSFPGCHWGSGPARIAAVQRNSSFTYCWPVLMVWAALTIPHGQGLAQSQTALDPDEYAWLEEFTETTPWQTRPDNVCQLQSEIVCALPRGECQSCRKISKLP